MDSEIILCPRCDTANRVPHARMGEGPKCGKCGATLFGGGPVAVDTARFDRLVRLGTLPVLADFWASWCGPCRMMAPVFEAAAAELEPHVRLVKVDIDAEPALAERFGIRSVPTLGIFRQGREIARQAGLVDKGRLVAWARAVIASV